jgi:hypothetical protein
MRPLVHFVLFTPKIARTHPENARTVSGVRAPARGIFRCVKGWRRHAGMLPFTVQ